jgi:short-subunit dehydrogenase
MEVNYFAPITLSKSLLPDMVKRKQGHHVVISSISGIINTPKRSTYGASKSAISSFYDSLRAEHDKDNIKVTVIFPGYVKTKLPFNALKGDGSPQDTMDKTHVSAISAERCAKKIIAAIEKEKRAVYIGGLKEKAGAYIKRFFPGLAAKIIRNYRIT